jgi:hypothetical protein
MSENQIIIRKLSSNGSQPHVNIPKDLVKSLKFDEFIMLEVNKEKQGIFITKLDLSKVD